MYQELLKALYDRVSDKDIPECDQDITRLLEELEELLQSEKELILRKYVAK